MMIERTGKYLPPDTAEALKLVDPRSVIAGVMIGATAAALVRRGIITSSSLALVGYAITLAQVLKYGGDAQHVLDLVAQAKKPEDLDRAAEALAALAENGAVDLFLTVAGIGAAKIAPKVAGGIGKATATAREYADDIARISREKWAEFKGKIENLKGDLPVVVTTNEGIPVVTTPNKLNGKGSNVVESRAQQSLSSGAKPVNLPAWNKLTFRVDPGETKPHFLTGHKVGENRLAASSKAGGKKTVFPEWMTDEHISAIKDAYNNSTKVKSTKYWGMKEL